MDCLIIAYFDKNTVKKSDFLGLRIADETEADDIKAGFVAQYNGILTDTETLAMWKERLDVEELPALKTYVGNNADDIETLREAGHVIDGWDKLNNRFIILGNSLTVKKHIINKKLTRIDKEYRTPRTLADAIAGNTWALSRIAAGEELSVPLREELAELTEE